MLLHLAEKQLFEMGKEGIRLLGESKLSLARTKNNSEITQKGWELRQELHKLSGKVCLAVIQPNPPVQSKANFKASSGCSGTCPAGFGTSPSMKIIPSFWSTFVLSLRKVFSVCLVSVFPSASCSCCLLCFCYAPLKRTMLFCLLYNPSSDSRITSSLSLFFRLNKPGPLGLFFLYCYSDIHIKLHNLFVTLLIIGFYCCSITSLFSVSCLICHINIIL